MSLRWAEPRSKVLFVSDAVQFDVFSLSVVKVKSSPSQITWAHEAVLISVSYSPQPNTSLHCEATNTGLVYRTACLFTPQLSPVPSYTAW